MVWSPGKATVASQVGQGHYYIGHDGLIFKQSAEQVSHVTDRKRLAQEAVRESQDPGQDPTVNQRFLRDTCWKVKT